jgi:hemerythrin-like domain-containing protein
MEMSAMQSGGAAGIVKTLMDQHRDTEALLDTLRRVSGSLRRGAAPEGDQLEDLDACRRALDGDVAMHFHLEEQAVFPILGRHIGMDAGPIAGMLADHQEVRRLAAQWSRSVAGARRGEPGAGASAADAADGLLDLLPDHIAREDGLVFPLAESTLSDEDWDEVARLWAAAEAAGARPLTAG